MVKTRNEIEKRIKIIIETLSPRVDVNKLVEKFRKHNILSGDVRGIIKGSVVIDVLNVYELCLLARYLYEITNDERVNYKELFTKDEIKKASEYKQEVVPEKLNYIIFENTMRCGTEDYMTTLTAEENKKLWDGKNVLYEEGQQRPFIIKEFAGGKYKAPFLDIKALNKIRLRIEEGDQIPNTIVFNVPEETEIIYDEKNRRLTIKGKCNIIDGYHRSLACYFAYQQNKNIDFYLKLNIVHWDQDRVKSFIWQEAQGNKLDPHAEKIYDTTSPYNKIINKINTATNSWLKNKISTDINDIKKGVALIPFNVFYDTLKYLYPELANESNVELIKIQKEILDKLNMIVENNPELLENKQSDLVWITNLMIIKYFDSESDIIKKSQCIDKNTLNKLTYNHVNKKLINTIKEEVL